MRTYASGLSACFFLFSACLSAAQVKGKVTDPSGAPVAGAKVSMIGRTGVSAQAVTSESGGFLLNAPDTPGLKLVVTAAGFAARTIPASAGSINVALDIAPVSESVQVLGSTLDVPLSEQGSSVSLVTAAEIRERNEPLAFDLLRYLPGMSFNQNGPTGSLSNLFLRGGNANSTLVQIDGIPVNAFGGVFDFAHLPSESIEQISVARGAQSAVYGSYANSGVIDFETRRASGAPSLELLAEGGTFRERRFGASASGLLAGFGVSASASRFDDNGPVINSDYRDEALTLNVSRRFRRQSLFLHGDFLSNSVGEPGPWGSDPNGTYSGLDTVSRSKNNTGDYGIRYEADLAPRVREELTGSFYLANNGYQSPYGFSFNKDIREQVDVRTVASVSPIYTVAFGVAGGREEVRNTFISDAAFSVMPIPRHDVAVYVENRFVIGHRLFLNAGVRGEWLRTGALAPDGYSRPAFPANTVAAVNPKVSAAYVTGGTRLHSSFGFGLRPPSGFDLAFTDNPALRPERTRSVDAGVEQRLGPIVADATYFYNKFYDLIVPLGGTQTALSRYRTANLAESQAQGMELSARARPSSTLLLSVSYTLLETRLLAAAPAPFIVGQPLTRRPEHSGAAVATYTRGRVSADLNAYFRGKALFEDPSYGASAGLFWNPGFANVGAGLNLALGRGVTAYGRLRNALDRHYEEVFGFPSPRLNFVAGLKWSIRGRE